MAFNLFAPTQTNWLTERRRREGEALGPYERAIAATTRDTMTAARGAGRAAVPDLERGNRVARDGGEGFVLKWTKTSDELFMREMRSADGEPSAMWEVHRRGPSTYVLLRSSLKVPGPLYATGDGLVTRYPRKAKVFATTSRKDGCYRAARRLETPKRLGPKGGKYQEHKDFHARAIEVLAGLSRAQVLAAHDALWPGEVRSARKARRTNSLQMRLRLAMALQSSADAGRHWEGECVLEEPLAALFIEARKQTTRAAGVQPPPVIKRVLSAADLAFRSAVESAGCSG